MNNNITDLKDSEKLQDLEDYELLLQTRIEQTVNFNDLIDLREAKKTSDKDFLSHDDVLKALSI